MTARSLFLRVVGLDGGKKPPRQAHAFGVQASQGALYHAIAVQAGFEPSFRYSGSADCVVLTMTVESELSHFQVRQKLDAAAFALFPDVAVQASTSCLTVLRNGRPVEVPVNRWGLADVSAARLPLIDAA